MEPGRRRPAPASLRLVQAFFNTYDALTDREILASAPDLERWMRRHRLDPGPSSLSERDLETAHRFREALRSAAALHNGAPFDRDALALLNRAAKHATLIVRFGEDAEPTLVPADDGIWGLVGAVLSAVRSGMQEGRWERLKACPACGWVFFDHSRNRSGSWCTMAICGSRSKMKAYRRRHADSSSSNGSES